MRSRRLVGGAVAFTVAMSGSAVVVATPASAGSVTSPAFSQNPDSIVTEQGSDGRVNLLEPEGAPIPRPSDVTDDAEPAEVAQAHLKEQASELGVSADQLEVERTSQLGRGDVVRFNQVAEQAPVFGGELVTALDPEGGLEFVLGDTVDVDGLNFPSDGVSEAELREVAEGAVREAEMLAEAVELDLEDHGPTWYDPEMVGAQSQTDAEGVRATQQFEVTSRSQGIRYNVLVNAETGEVELAHTMIADAQRREVCDGANEPASSEVEFACLAEGGLEPVRSEGDPESGIDDADAIYDAMDATSVRFASYVNVDLTELIGVELSDGEKALLGTSRVCIDGEECPFPNAFWDGFQASFGDGMATTDIVAHELTHGVNEKTAGLTYLYQSGAIDEGLSDVWGKLVQLGSEDVADEDRWDIGTGSALGVMRNLEDPTQHELPDTLTSEHWFDDGGTLEDNGGVHINMGPLMKAGYLMVDGDSFNGYDIEGLGLAKTGKIMWSVQNLLTSGADYKDVFHTMPLACRKNIDAEGSHITEADCEEVDKIVRATEMYEEPAQGSPHNIDYCDDGSEPSEVFGYEGFEEVNDSWNWEDNWTLSSERPFNGRQPNANVGDDAAYGFLETDGEYALTSTEPAEVPEGAEYIRFDHMYLINEGSGARFEYSTDGGETWENGSSLPNDHGEAEFSGSSSGWSASRYDVSSLVGEELHVRFVLNGVGETPEQFGDRWWVDNAKTYACG